MTIIIAQARRSRPERRSSLDVYKRQAFVDGTLKDMTVSVDVNGTEYPMTYNDTTKRFEYVKNGLTNGKTHYRYKANGNYVVDAFNSNSEKYNNADYSYFEYYKLNATVTAEVMNKSFNYNENNVVKMCIRDRSKCDRICYNNRQCNF